MLQTRCFYYNDVMKSSLAGKSDDKEKESFTTVPDVRAAMLVYAILV